MTLIIFFINMNCILGYICCYNKGFQELQGRSIVNYRDLGTKLGCVDLLTFSFAFFLQRL